MIYKAKLQRRRNN